MQNYVALTLTAVKLILPIACATCSNVDCSQKFSVVKKLITTLEYFGYNDINNVDHKQRETDVSKKM